MIALKLKTLVTAVLILALGSLATELFANGDKDKSPEKESVEIVDQNARRAICQTLNYYYEGSNLHSVDAVGEAFHPKAHLTLLNTKTGTVKDMAVQDILSGLAVQNGWMTKNLKLQNVNIEGNSAIATVKVQLTDGTKSTEHISLLKEKNGWLIVSLTAYQK